MLFRQILRMMFTFKKQTKNLEIRKNYFSWLNTPNDEWGTARELWSSSSSSLASILLLLRHYSFLHYFPRHLCLTSLASPTINMTVYLWAFRFISFLLSCASKLLLEAMKKRSEEKIPGRKCESRQEKRIRRNDVRKISLRKWRKMFTPSTIRHNPSQQFILRRVRVGGDRRLLRGTWFTR
jgi:hypothetical protein